MTVMVRNENRHGFRRATTDDMRTGKVFYRMMKDPLPCGDVPVAVSSSRETLFAKDESAEYGFRKAAESDVKGGNIYRLNHDAMMGRHMVEVPAEEVSANRWKYDLVLTSGRGVARATSETAFTAAVTAAATPGERIADGKNK